MDILQNHGLTILFILMVFNGFISMPPSEAILLGAGTYASSSNTSIYPIICIAVAGNLIGALLLYGLGRLIGERRCLRFLTITTSIIYKKKSITKLYIFIRRFTRYFYNHDAILLLMVFRSLPVVRSIVSLPAGFLKYNLISFIGFSLLGMIVWATAWVSTGAHLQVLYANSKNLRLLFSVVSIFLVYAILHYRIKKHLREYKK
jgi:membrane protein DedA with SNARE-associated domain